MGNRQGARESWAKADAEAARKGKTLFSKFYDSQREFSKKNGKDPTFDQRTLNKLNHLLRTRFPTLRKYRIMSLIATGSSGLVCTLMDEESGIMRAGKFVGMSDGSTGRFSAAESPYVIEARLQERCAHPHVVELIDFVTEGDLSIFVLEYVPSTLLQHIVRCNEAGTYSEWNAAQYVLQVAEALDHCHKCDVVHLDVKLDNLLVNGSSVKLCDFGLASRSPCDRNVATPLFCAPEILSIGKADTKSDMWSLGVVLFILLCGYPPFLDGAHNRTLNENILGARYQFISPHWDGISGLARDLVAKLLVRDTKKRYSAQQVLNHPWIVACRNAPSPSSSNMNGGERPSSIRQVRSSKPTTKSMAIPSFSDRKLSSNTNRLLSELNQQREKQKRTPKAGSSFLMQNVTLNESDEIELLEEQELSEEPGALRTEFSSLDVSSTSSSNGIKKEKSSSRSSTISGNSSGSRSKHRHDGTKKKTTHRGERARSPTSHGAAERTRSPGHGAAERTRSPGHGAAERTRSPGERARSPGRSDSKRPHRKHHADRSSSTDTHRKHKSGKSKSKENSVRGSSKTREGGGASSSSSSSSTRSGNHKIKHKHRSKSSTPKVDAAVGTGTGDRKSDIVSPPPLHSVVHREPTFAAMPVTAHEQEKYVKRSMSSLHKAATWVPDAEAAGCRICGRDFGMLVRKHHCRACGQIICERCSATRRLVKAVNPTQPVRVCDRCKVPTTSPAPAQTWSM